MIQFPCKFGELKCNPCWFIMLTSSHGTNYVFNVYEDFNQYDPYAGPISNSIRENTVLQLSCDFGESKWKPVWDIVLMNGSGTNYDLKTFCQYKIPPQIMPSCRYLTILKTAQSGSYAIYSEPMSCYIYRASFVNQNEIPVQLSCERTHLSLIMSLTSMKILTNVAHMQYHPS